MGHVDHLSWGNPDHVFFFVIFNVAFIFYLSVQEAFFAGSLTKTLPLLTIIDYEQIYLWNPMTTGLISHYVMIWAIFECLT